MTGLRVERSDMKRRLSVLIAVVVCAAFSFLFRVIPLRAQIIPLYIVNTTSDTVVADACFNGTAGCSLRGAILEANSVSESAVTFAIPASDPNCPNGVCTINLTQLLPDLSTNMTINGPGAGSLIVRRNEGGTYRIFHLTTTGFVTFLGITISNGVGGIINDNAATLNLTDCVLTENSNTAGLGGGIYNNSAGSVNVTSCTISGNSAGRGGGIFNNGTGTVTVTNSTISDNHSNGSGNTGGGGIYNNSTGNLNITNSTIGQNEATVIGVNNGRGGGIYNENGTVNVIGSTIGPNFLSCTQGSLSGGGIFNASGIVNVANCAIRFNALGFVQGQPGSITCSGGGIFNGSGTLNVTNTTLSNNSLFALTSGGSARGGGIFTDTGTVNVSNSTVSSNKASGFPVPMMLGGGIFNVAGTVNVKSAIIALNTVESQNGDPGSNPDASGTFASQGFNLIGMKDGSTGFNQPTDQTGTLASPLDPKLDPFERNNGGPTMTFALLPGSPAIDRGESHCLAACGPSGVLPTDQRDTGFARTFDDPAVLNATGGDGTDIGAFEAQGSLVTRLANISTRLPVQTGDNVLIGGFIVTGTQPKKVIVRAIGPSISVAGQLADPTLELRDSSGVLIRANDNWRTDQEAEIVATTIPPSNDLESAIVETLPANSASYTAIVRGANNETGIGLVEAYDLDAAVDSKLANISTRGLVQTEDNVLIAGTIVLGDLPQRVLVRAIGPSLSLPGKLEDPILEVRNGNGVLVRSNDNWRSNQEAEIMATTIPPTNDLESAMVVTLPAGGAAYTAILRGVGGTTGIAVVEIYALN
jgi:CSLREA domain-containing protein